MWSPMTIEEFAQSEAALGAEIVQESGFFWRKIRPFFYRPLLIHKQYSPQQVTSPPGKFISYQYALLENSASISNSKINLMVYNNLADYSIESLRKHHRRHVRAVLKSEMELRPIDKVEDLIRDGYPVYCSFYERSRYEFGKDRLDKTVFTQWANDQISQPGILVLGVYLKKQLLGIYISCRIEDTVYLKAAINSKEAIQLRAPELALHAYREEARDNDQIKLIVDGPYVPSDGVNAFKFRRGAKGIAIPAHIHANPLFLKSLKICKPKAYHTLVGFAEDEMCENPFSKCHEG